MYSVTLATSLMVPTLGFPVYRFGLLAISFSFSMSLMAFPTILLSGITAQVSAAPNSNPYINKCTFDGIMPSGITNSGAEKINPVHVSGSD